MHGRLFDRPRAKRPRATRVGFAVAAGFLSTILLSGCGAPTAPHSAGVTSTGTISVVATINAWGSIAAQLGGSHVHETSLITNPNTDPHVYEPTPADARIVAGAQVVVLNGIGYDPWAQKLLDANPVAGRTVIKIGALVGVLNGGNPHQWYSPGSVRSVIEAITADYKKADPADSSYFDAQKQRFLASGMSEYIRLIAEIKARYSGTPVGASESIFTPLANALGLNLITPVRFLKDISEGTDPSAADKSLIDQQIATKAMKVYVFNSQNSTPDIQAQVDAAKKQGIPVSAVTETLAPATTRFQDWQIAQLQKLETALKLATNK
jgi:zinc/manganese transport system substrate-binding protein